MQVVQIPGYPARAYTDNELDTIAERLLQLHVIDHRVCLFCQEVGSECRPREWARGWSTSRAPVPPRRMPRQRIRNEQQEPVVRGPSTSGPSQLFLMAVWAHVSAPW